MTGKYTIINGDITEILKDYSGELFHAQLSDPPYHLTSITERFSKEDSAPAKYGTDGVFQRSSKGFMGQCYDPSTEILTEDGWISIKTIVDNRYSRKVYSLNPETDEIEFVNAIDWQRYFFEGELLNFTGRSIDLLVTPNHKLWLSYGNGKKKFAEARSVNSNFSMYNQGEWNHGENRDFLSIGDKKYPAKAFMRFLGIYLGDGCVVHRKKQPKKQDFISISAKISRKKDSVISCLTSLGVKFTQHDKQTLVYDKNLNEYLSQFGYANGKHIPNWVFCLSKDLQEELLTGLLETDGHVGSKHKCIQYFTSSKRLADGVQRLAIHCGLSTTIGYRHPRKASILGRNTFFNGGYVLSFLQKNKKLWFEKIDHKNKKQRLLSVSYSGYVYDITLDKNHILLTRRNGKTVWSSNSWDGGDIAFRPETWKIIAGTLFPGAFGISFASARGWHRLAVGIEDGGNIIHPSIFGWAYGCLSEDTEILTVDGWKSYKECLHGTMVACYNVNNGTFQWMPVQETFEYDYNETAYSIQSEYTDQLVSRNHRVIVNRGGKPCFEFAERLAPQEEIYIARPAQGQDELQPEAQAKGAGNYLPRMWNAGLQACRMASENSRYGWRLLFQKLPGQGQRGETSYSALRQRQGQAQPQKESLGRKQSSLEGWSNLLSQAWQLCANQIRTLSFRVLGNGSQRRLCYGASVDCGSTPGAVFEAVRSSTSYQPRPAGQHARKPDAVFEQHGTQEARSDWAASPHLATVTPTHYIGKVWCVRVPTGAFVARRNGHAFVTGNSGFPKATRIDTQIDKAAGAERDRTGITRHRNVKPYDDENGWNANNTTGDFEYTAPATPLAATWAGHRYGLQALKPALEPIIVFQKPYEGRPVECITETGAGALWIEGGRIATDQPYTVNTWDDDAHPFGNGAGNPYTSRKESARWPANFVLDEAAAKRLDEQSGELKSGDLKPWHKANGIPSNTYAGGVDGSLNSRHGASYGDSGGASRFFFCYVADALDEADPVRYQAKASRAERDAGLDEFPIKESTKQFMVGEEGAIHSDGHARANKPIMAHNPHPTLKPIGLTHYLATLLLPPAEYAPRRIIIPFAGAGSEMIGALLAGWEDVVGIELKKSYSEIAKNRIDFWLSLSEKYQVTDFKKLLKLSQSPKEKKLRDILSNDISKQTKIF